MKNIQTPKNVILQVQMNGSWPAWVGPVSHRTQVTESGKNWAGPVKTKLLFINARVVL